MWKRVPESGQLILFVLVCFMTILGACASYAYKMLRGELFSLRILALQILIAVFSGSLILMAAYHYDWASELAGGIAGLAGWSGAGFIKLLEQRFLNNVENSNDHQQ